MINLANDKDVQRLQGEIDRLRVIVAAQSQQIERIAEALAEHLRVDIEELLRRP